MKDFTLKLLNVQEVAKLIGVRPSTIYQWTSQEYIPHIKVGKLVRFDRNEILKWLNSLKTVGRNSRKLDVSDFS